MLKTLSLICTILPALFFMYAGIVSFFENEKRAGSIFLGLSVFCILMVFLVFTKHILADYVMLIWTLGFIVMIIILGLPIKGKSGSATVPNAQIDERITMFSRALIQPGTIRYSSFYSDYPQLESVDAKWRKKPGLLSPYSKFYDKKYYAAADASFKTCEILSKHRNKEANADALAKLDHWQNATFIKKYAAQIGAMTTGFTRLEDYHWYHTHGRGEKYGTPVTQRHSNAIVFSVAMDHKLVQTAPQAPTVMESANQYARAALIANQIADWVAMHGYEARTHIDGGYDLVCPLVARDAGLGEIGRMGLLITPEVGPRCRIAIVSTNMPLPNAERQSDKAVISFCNDCKKCALVCPSGAIPFDAPKEIQGIRRWQINQEKCFSYWCQVGTDCARCISVCPYSHPNNLLHRAIRAGIRHNLIFRKIAIKADDLFYGKSPAPKKPHSI